MTRSELVKRLSEKYPDMYIHQAEQIVECILSDIINTLKQGRRVEIRGFGSFTIRKREARVARNPKTGEKIAIEERHAIYFRSGKRLRDLMNS